MFLFATQTIVTSIVVFAILIILLVMILLYAKAKLAPSGPVKLTINGKKEIEVESGATLLQTLGNNKIFLPSACGGGGTCGMCTCQVNEGGGELLPTEEPYFTRKEAQDKWRLGCQVKVKQDMDISIPEEIFGIKKWECEVVSNYNVSTFIKAFVVRLPEGETMDFKAGGYIQIDVPKTTVDYKDFDISPEPTDPLGKDKFKEDWDKFKLWDLKMVNDDPIMRAYSMANAPYEGSIVMLTIRIATPPFDREKGGWANVNPGICSSYIWAQKPGDKVTVSGPYGEFFIQDTGAEMIYIGGGAGMAPMRSHLFHLFHTLKTNRKVTYWYGARSKRELFFESDFRAIEKDFPNFQFNIVLSEPMEEDNWKAKNSLTDEGDGFLGFVHQAVIDNQLSKHDAPEDIEFYFCGPPMMNNAVVKMTDDWGIPTENVHFDDFGG
ncbi:MAG: NADH:ubiquinone reductase (Na(+)-transporting) subunit F [Ichthyobacteriaceae bacterium]|nr:NADH:ubiquinone reductase (Na(+)-transporting) subunit F [Ichthyobacteriaceae bacterium]